MQGSGFLMGRQYDNCYTQPTKQANRNITSGRSGFSDFYQGYLNAPRQLHTIARNGEQPVQFCAPPTTPRGVKGSFQAVCM